MENSNQLWRKCIDLVRTRGTSEAIDAINEIREQAERKVACDDVRICDRVLSTIRQSLQ